MGLILGGLAALVFLALGVALMALAIPWIVSIAGGTEPARHWHLELRPFSRDFPARLRFAAQTGGERANGVTLRKRDKQQRSGGRTGQPGRQRACRMLRAAPQLLSGLLSVFRIDHLRLQGRLGLADPADTGQIFGVLMPLAYAFPERRVQIELTPDFSGPVLDGAAEARIRLVPMRALPPVLRFGWQVFARPG